MKHSQERRIIFFQPGLPLYRKNFFASLIKQSNCKVLVFFAQNNDLRSISTDSNDVFGFIRHGSYISLLNIVSWHTKCIAQYIGKNDIIVLTGNIRCISTLYLVAYCKIKKIRVLWWSHLYGAHSKTYFVWLRLFLASIGSHALLLYTDKEVAEYYDNFYRHIRIPAFSLNNGLDTSLISLLREPYVPSARKYSALFIGRVSKKANLALLLKALSMFPRETDFKLAVIGDGRYLHYCKSLAKQLDVNHLIDWFGAIRNEQHIAKIANNSKLFVYPGSVGLSLMHGLCYGLPALIHSNSRAHMPESAAFQDKSNGIAFSEGSPSSLHRQLDALLGRPEIMTKMSSNAIKTIEQSYNTNDMVIRMLRVLDCV